MKKKASFEMKWNGMESTTKTLAKYFTQNVIITNNKKLEVNKKCKELKKHKHKYELDKNNKKNKKKRKKKIL